MNILCYETRRLIGLDKMKYCASHMRAYATGSYKFRMDNISLKVREAEAAKLKSYFEYPIKNKASFMSAISVYNSKEKRSYRGQVGFILAALKMMKEYGVAKDQEVYLELLHIFPKGTFIPENIVQIVWFHYGLQQGCAVAVLDQMEANLIMPSSALEETIESIFGPDSTPSRKLARMMYWTPKLRYLSPWFLPDELPESTLDLACMAVKRMATMDSALKITVFNSNVEKKEGRILRCLPSRQIHKATDANTTATEVDLPGVDAPREDWIVSCICDQQRQLIKQHNVDEPLKVEGPFRIYLKDKHVSYFILRAEPGKYPPPETAADYDDVSSMYNWIKKESRAKDQLTKRTIHEQDDGTILGICSTENSSKRSLLSWIRVLEKDSPELENIPILFPQTSPIGDVIVREEKTDKAVQPK